MNGNVTNDGFVKTTGAPVTWNGTFTNNNSYVSNPSTQTFVGNLNVTSTGFLVGNSLTLPQPPPAIPAAQDMFIFKSDFINNSTQNAKWNTDNAEMQFVAGASNTHQLYVPGGFVALDSIYKTGNFGWYNFTIGANQIINLVDPTPNSLDTGALYVNQVVGATFSGGVLTNIFNTSQDFLWIVYDPNDPANKYLVDNGSIFSITGGSGDLLYPDPSGVPLPPSVLLLCSGLLGMGALGWQRRKQG